MSPGPWRVAVVGATGAVGREMLRLVSERLAPIESLRLFTSPRSAGTSLSAAGGTWTTEVPAEGCFDGTHLALFSAGAAVSREWGPKAVAAGALVVDNSSAFRMDPGVPLVVPEINPGDLPRPPALVANPNCSTIQMVMALKPLHDLFELARVIVATYQSASGAGRRALEELEDGTAALQAGRPERVERFPHPIAMNLIPQVDEFAAADYTREEWKLVYETRKILGLPDLRVTPTCVRVPVRRAHSEMVWASFRKEVDLAAARKALAAFPGVVVEDEPLRGRYPMPRTAEGRDEVFVGRLRRDPGDARSLVFWVVSDNLLKGAALNAVQIAEQVLGTGGSA